jgi:iron complex transport system substrate-binding protein
MRIVSLLPSATEIICQLGLREQLVGDAAGCATMARREIELLRGRIQAVATRTLAIQARPTVLLLEWIDPPFSSGHWSPELV